MPEGPAAQLILLLVEREQALARAEEYLTRALGDLRNAGEAVKATDQQLAREIDAGAEVVDRVLSHVTDLRRPAKH
jgi:hypothetical protein